ncbi:MAG: caspase family protein, partial [Mariprofundaceae bacterium]
SNLKYAVKDSKDMTSSLLSKAASIYGAENIFVENISNAQASRAGIMNAINTISAKIKPTDHFILFVASHGVLLGEQYYMVTHDYDGALNPSKLISSNEIVDLSKKIKALSQLYILDTCHAGGMDGVISGLYDARMSVLAKKMGLHIFASSNSVEEALDGYKGNGLFTHTLLDGLNNNTQADKNSDRTISLKELGGFSKAKTKSIAEGLGHSQEPLIINFGQDNPVYKLQ